MRPNCGNADSCDELGELPQPDLESHHAGDVAAPDRPAGLAHAGIDPLEGRAIDKPAG